MPIPFQPSLPAAPCFDAARDAWIFSRYIDVSAALHETSLRPSSASFEPGTPGESPQHARLVAEVQADIARMSTPAWRTHMEQTLASRLRHERGRRRIDLVREIIHPWATTMLVTLNGGEAIYSRHLAQISERLFSGSKSNAESRQDTGRELAHGSGASEQELDRMLEGRELLLSRPMFIGLTQTIPSFLAKAWLALLQHPGQIAQLIDDPKLMANATEELLRYAGVVHTLYRRSTRDLRIGDIPIREGQLVILELDSANFDPERFDQPERLNVTRQPAGHLGLGKGLRACVGSFLARMACSVATPILLATHPRLLPRREVQWTGDSTMLWPLSIQINFARSVAPRESPAHESTVAHIHDTSDLLAG